MAESYHADETERTRRAVEQVEARTEHDRGGRLIESGGASPLLHLLGDKRLGQRGNSAVKAATVQRAQQIHGNRVVQRVISSRAPVAVQRRAGLDLLGSAIPGLGGEALGGMFSLGATAQSIATIAQNAAPKAAQEAISHGASWSDAREPDPRDELRTECMYAHDTDACMELSTAESGPVGALYGSGGTLAPGLRDIRVPGFGGLLGD